MEGWILMSHDTYADYASAHGYLIGNFYSDIESVCRAITDDTVHRRQIADIQYNNDGQKVLLVASDGALYGAYLCVMPMREDRPMWRKS